MHNFLVSLMDKLINGHPEQLQGLIFQFILVFGFGFFTVSMVAWAITNAKLALKSNTGGGR